jgi:hypothetical protein
MTALTIAGAGANTTSAGPLTLILPLVVLAVVVAVWWIGLRRGHARRGAGSRPDGPGGTGGR